MILFWDSEGQDQTAWMPEDTFRVAKPNEGWIHFQEGNSTKSFSTLSP